jgi:hypothetical protein
MLRAGNKIMLQVCAATSGFCQAMCHEDLNNQPPEVIKGAASPFLARIW